MLAEEGVQGKAGKKRSTLGRWTEEEHNKFIYAIQLYGKDWRRVQNCVGTRTTLQIRSHAQKYFINWQKKSGDVDLREKGFTQKCVNELLKKLSTDEQEIEVSDFNAQFEKRSETNPEQKSKRSYKVKA